MSRALQPSSSSSVRLRQQLACALVCALIVWFLPHGARADAASQLVLHWVRAEGAESCAAGSELEQQLRNLLGAELESLPPLRLEGVVRRDPASGLLNARLRLLDANERTLGVRELSSTEAPCEKFTPSVVLVMSVLVEFASRGAAPHPTSRQPARRIVDGETIPALSGAKRADRRQQPTSAAPWRFDLLASLALGLRLTPGLGVGPVLSLRAHTPWLPVLALRAGYWPSETLNLAVRADARPAKLTIHTVSSELGVCFPLLRDRSWWMASCLGAALIVRATHTQGLEGGARSLRVTGGASAALQLAYAMGERWQLALDASLLALRQSDPYVFDTVEGDRRTVFRPGHFAGVIGIGFGIRI